MEIIVKIGIVLALFVWHHPAKAIITRAFTDTARVKKPDGGLSDKQIANMIIRDGKDIHRANVMKDDSMIYLTANIRMDHRIFGYEKPDLNSKKMLVISVFTDDVEGNPFHCAYGAYYDINGSPIQLKYTSATRNFIKADVVKDKKVQGVVYISKKWIKFV